MSVKGNLVMKGKLVIALSFLAAYLSAWGDVYSEAASEPVHVDTTFDSHVPLASKMPIMYSPFMWDPECSVTLNGDEFISSTNESTFIWQPRQLGENVLMWSSAGVTMTSTVNVERLTFYVPPKPNPPMPVDDNISITPVTRTFEQDGGGGAIVTSGSGVWTATVSDSWIVLNANSGSAGYPVAYVVNASALVGDRVGYVYVSGRAHAVTQHGYTSSISPASAEFEMQGGSGSVAIQAVKGITWNAKPDTDWISVSPTEGAGPGMINYIVAPYNDAATRTGTITIGDKIFTVRQMGRGVKLSTYRVDRTGNYPQFVTVKVSAHASTRWSVIPNVDWISVHYAGSGVGSDSVQLTLANNPTEVTRYGTVTIGTETLLIVQGEAITITPEKAAVVAEGGNATVYVGAWPEVSWGATVKNNWLTILGDTAQGMGCGNVDYTVLPNPTLYERTGTIEISENGSQRGRSVLTHTVTQSAATARVSPKCYEFEAGGGTCSVIIDTANIVEWEVTGCPSWLTVTTGATGVGAQTVELRAAKNGSVYPRTAKLKIAENDFAVTQKGYGVEVEYDAILFERDGGMGSLSIHPGDYAAWQAVSSDATWITVFQNDSGTGDASITYIISPYMGNNAARTGYIGIGDKKVYITQRSYDMNIDPYLAEVTGEAGDGSVNVFAPNGSVWNVFSTEPWIKVITEAGSGNGTVAYQFSENLTGKVRSGKIIISGEEHMVTQTYGVPEVLRDPVITPSDGSIFKTDTCVVMIATEAEDATIYYSTNGQIPSTTEDCRYKGPFTITGTTMIRAVAVRGEEKSGYVSSIITKINTAVYTDAVVGKDVTGLDEPVTVPATWVTDFLAQHFGTGKENSFRQLFGENLAAALAKPTGKLGPGGEVRTVWDDYVAGTDPTDPASVFTTTIAIVDGKIVLDWSPNLNLGSVNRLYRVKSKLKLSDTWTCPPVTGHHFFMTEVAMPDGKTQTASPGVIGNASPDVNGGADKLAHRWSFNGNLADAVSGKTGSAIGGVSADGTSYTLPGGTHGTGYLDLGHVFPTNEPAMTLEIWATQISTKYYSHIFHVGRVSPMCMEWSLATFINYDELGCPGINTDNNGFCTHLAPYTLGTEFHISVVVAPQADGTSKVAYCKRDATTGEILKKCEYTSPTGWSLAMLDDDELCLGHDIGESNVYDANARYNEVRIWNRALSEDEIKKSVEAGPDLLPLK